CTVNCGYKPAALVGYTASADLCVILISFVRIEVPVVDISNTYCVDMCIVSDDLIACSHVADDISLRIDNDLIEVQFLHLSGDSVDVSLFVAAFHRILHVSAMICVHIFLITLCSFLDFLGVPSIPSPSLIGAVFCMT